MKNFIAENKKYIRAVIRKFTGNNSEDIEQDVYIKIWQNMPKYSEQGKLKQWISTVTANVCRDYFRSKNYKIHHMEVESEEALDNVTAKNRPDEIIDAKTRQKIILKAVDDLPKLYREVIVLFEFEDYPLEKIAARLNVPVGTIKSRLHNARQILKDKLKFLQGDLL